MQASSFGNYIDEEAFKNSFVQQSRFIVKPIEIKDGMKWWVFDKYFQDKWNCIQIK